METRLLGCSHTENPITTTAATTNTRHNTLKKNTVKDLEELTRLIKLDNFTMCLKFFLRILRVCLHKWHALNQRVKRLNNGFIIVNINIITGKVIHVNKTIYYIFKNQKVLDTPYIFKALTIFSRCSKKKTTWKTSFSWICLPKYFLTSHIVMKVAVTAVTIINGVGSLTFFSWVITMAATK